MNVEDAIGKRVDEDRAQQAHEAGQADDGDAALAQFADQRTIVILAARVGLVTEDQRLDPGLDRVIEPRRIGAIGDHDRDRRIEPLVVNRVDDRLEI